MDIAAFVISLFALLFAIIGVGLAMRALYLIGINAGLDKTIQNQSKPTQQKVTNIKKFSPKEPLRIEGDKIIYNDDPLVYVIENFISEEECAHFVQTSSQNLERAKTIGGKDGIYHMNRTGMNLSLIHI